MDSKGGGGVGGRGGRKKKRIEDSSGKFTICRTLIKKKGEGVYQKDSPHLKGMN